MSLFCPPAGFPPHLALVWPLIWAQILVLRAWVRASYGRGTLYQWSVTPWGQVFLVSIDWVPGEGPAPVLPQLAARAGARIAAATDGRMFSPDYAGLNPLSLGVRGHGATGSSALAAMPLPLIPNPCRKPERGPPPEN